MYHHVKKLMYTVRVDEPVLLDVRLHDEHDGQQHPHRDELDACAPEHPPRRAEEQPEVDGVAREREIGRASCRERV